MQDERGQPLIVLMHGDRQVSTKNLARQIGAKSVEPCKPEVAQRHSGYLVGGTSPFGTRKAMPVYVEASVLDAAAHLHQRRPARLPGRHRAAVLTEQLVRNAGAVRAGMSGGACRIAAITTASRDADLLPVAGRPGRLPDRLAVVRRHRQPRDGPERPAQLRLGQPRRDQRAALGQQGRRGPDAAARCAEGLRAGLAGRRASAPPAASAKARWRWSALAAFVGHLWPVFFRFQGGKGVATAAGVLFGINPWLGLATLLTWLIIAAFFRYSSLAALVAAAFAPFYQLLIWGGGPAARRDRRDEPAAGVAPPRATSRSCSPAPKAGSARSARRHPPRPSRHGTGSRHAPRHHAAAPAEARDARRPGVEMSPDCGDSTSAIACRR